MALGMRRQHLDREHLEAREARLDRLGDLVEERERELALEGHVEGVIGVGVPLPAGRAGFDRLRDVRPRADEAEVHVGGRAAEDHPARVLLRAERVEVVLGMHRDEVGEVRVRLDAARDDDLPRRVDHPSGLRSRVVQADGDDALTLDSHVPPADALRRHDVASANHEIQHGPPLLLQLGLRLPPHELRVDDDELSHAPVDPRRPQRCVRRITQGAPGQGDARPGPL